MESCFKQSDIITRFSCSVFKASDLLKQITNGWMVACALFERNLHLHLAKQVSSREREDTPLPQLQIHLIVDYISVL
jgi:hypothetical protein